ncbi:hypothetical protein BGZ63DRAFT_398379 [Mariannaea sp. PMI_226]|nr:hypothetical protein BGZ63DRAFT_398379 [Mariannaea sp. PMI_226]
MIPLLFSLPPFAVCLSLSLSFFVLRDTRKSYLLLDMLRSHSCRLLFLTLLSSYLQFSSADRRKCYYPNGDEAVNDRPCNPNLDQSACCGSSSGSACSTNLLCIDGNGGFIRGSCTDKTWGSEFCPSYCLSADTGGTNLVSCSNVTGTSTSYCCDHTDGCCDSGVGQFQVPPSKPDTWATYNPQSSHYVVLRALTNAPTSAKTTATGRPGAASTTSRLLPSTTGDKSATTSQAAGSTEGLSSGVKIGIGIGVGVGVLLIATVAFLLWKLRKSKKMMEAQTQAQTQPPNPYAYGPGGWPPMTMNVGAAWSPESRPKSEARMPQELDSSRARAELEGQQP